MEQPIRIELEGGRRLVISWPGGETSELSAARLRRVCPCATCGGGFEPLDESAVTITAIEPSGAYGVRLSFAPDGHQTGIYSYEYLRELGSQ